MRQPREASRVQGTSTNFQYSHSQRMRMRSEPLDCCHQLRLLSVSDLYIFLSRKSHRYRVKEDSTETPSRMHQDKKDSVKNAWSSDQTREVPDIEMASRISLHNFAQHTRQVIIWRLIRAKPHIEHL